MVCQIMNSRRFRARGQEFVVLRAGTFGGAMTTATHRVAKNVIKFLRWRNSDEDGQVADGFMGVVFDASEQNPSPVDDCPWILAERGQGGYWRPHTEHWYVREWIHEWSLEHRQLLHGGVIAVAGCRPIVGTIYPDPGTRGALWDINITVTLAVAGVPPRKLYVHPGSKREAYAHHPTHGRRACGCAAGRHYQGLE